METLTQADIEAISKEVVDKLFNERPSQMQQVQSRCEEKLEAQLKLTGLKFVVKGLEYAYVNSNRAKPGYAAIKKARLQQLNTGMENVLVEGGLCYLDYILCEMRRRP